MSRSRAGLRAQSRKPTPEQEYAAQSRKPNKSEFSALKPDHLSYLHRTVGNQGVIQLMRSVYASVLPADGIRQTPASESPVRRKPNRTGMPDSLKERLEAGSGVDLSDVRVHYNSDKPARIQARAYTQGNEIHLGPGQERYLPHEGWHAVQQKQGRVTPTGWYNGQAVNEDEALEQEADTMGLMPHHPQSTFDRSSSFSGKADGVANTAASPIQLIKVTKDDIGKTFTIITTDGEKCEGVLTTFNRGWYYFNVKGKPKVVHGAGNILSRSDLDESSEDSDSASSSESDMDLEQTDPSSSSSVSDTSDSEEDDALPTDLTEFDLDKIAKERNIPRRKALRLVRDSFRENPRTIRLRFLFGMKTISKGRPSFNSPDETEKAPQAMVSYRKRDYDKHRKLGKDYDVWAPEFSDDEESETEKRKRARTINTYLETSKAVSFDSWDTRQKIALGGLLSVTHISDPLRTDADHESTERDFREQLKSRERGETGFRDIFGDKSTSTFLPARTGGSSQQREMIREVLMAKLLWVNNCLINAICQAVYGRNATQAELVAIRAQTGSVGEMLAASDRTIGIITNVLGIEDSIVVHYPTSTGLPNEQFGNGDNEIHIYHTGGNHFVHNCPDPKNYYWD